MLHLTGEKSLFPSFKLSLQKCPMKCNSVFVSTLSVTHLYPWFRFNVTWRVSLCFVTLENSRGLLCNLPFQRLWEECDFHSLKTVFCLQFLFEGEERREMTGKWVTTQRGRDFLSPVGSYSMKEGSLFRLTEAWGLTSSSSEKVHSLASLDPRTASPSQHNLRDIEEDMHWVFSSERKESRYQFPPKGFFVFLIW